MISVTTISNLKKRYNKYNEKRLTNQKFNGEKLIRNYHISGRLADILMVLQYGFLTAKDIAYDLNVSVPRANKFISNICHHRGVQLHNVKDVNHHCTKVTYNKDKSGHVHRAYHIKENVVLGKYKPETVISCEYYKNFILTMYDPKLSPFEHKIINKYQTYSRISLSKKIAILKRTDVFRKEAYRECINHLRMIYWSLKNNNVSHQDITSLGLFIKRRSKYAVTTVIDNMDFHDKHMDLYSNYSKTPSKLLNKEIKYRNKFNSRLNNQ